MCSCEISDVSARSAGISSENEWLQLQSLPCRRDMNRSVFQRSKQRSADALWCWAISRASAKSGETLPLSSIQMTTTHSREF
jgi:hypothetical protein